MTNNEQIKQAETAIKLLQDYIELVKVEKKMKTVTAADEIATTIAKIVGEVQDIAKDL